jgi:CrcB protein
LKLILAVALGGALGSVGRLLVARQMLHWFGTGFPWGTLTVNVVGSFLMGVLIETMALRWSVGPELRGFLVVGLLGGFTTFSTFSLDVVVLFERGQAMLSAGYILASVAVSVAGLFAGMHLVRSVLA